MAYHGILHYTVLYCTILSYYTVLYCTIPYHNMSALVANPAPDAKHKHNKQTTNNNNNHHNNNNNTNNNNNNTHYYYFYYYYQYYYHYYYYYHYQPGSAGAPARSPAWRTPPPACEAASLPELLLRVYTHIHTPTL